ncbi:hypothetical protein WG947_04520 [Pontibacter sp. H259]|uniref:hypothetical protein n=1 Tax=Pontibacter sp. H259 TaxID=3133421 RepID=UPI0030BF76D4
MVEIRELKQKIEGCTLLTLKTNAEQINCQFFQNGIYKDTMYITHPALINVLHRLAAGGEEIQAGGLTKLKRVYLEV